MLKFLTLDVRTGHEGEVLLIVESFGRGNTSVYTGDRYEPMSPADVLGILNQLNGYARGGIKTVTWNGMRYAFKALAEGSGHKPGVVELAMGSIDISFMIHCMLGYPISLTNALKENGLENTLAGESVVKTAILWDLLQHEEAIDKAINYVEAVHDLVEVYVDMGQVTWTTARGKTMIVESELLTVSDALKLPLPDVSWMEKPIPRKDYLGWVK